MAKSIEISNEEAKEIKEYRKKVRDKFTDRRLQAVQLRGEGKRNKEVAEQLEVDPRMVSQWVRQYRNGGIEELNPKPTGGRPPKLTFAEEEALLNEFKKKAEAGEIIEVSKIKAAYEKLAGSSKSRGHIYRVLKRHGWRKIKPRSRHPKKANPEAIEASKKLSEL